MRELTPSEVFAERLRAARQSAGLSQAQVVERLERLGYRGLKRQAIIDIEQKRRRVSLDEALALSAAVGVAPINMMVPFERDVLIDAPSVIPGDGARELEDVFYKIDASLKIGDGHALIPLEARAWIRGVKLWPSYAPPPDWYQFYVVQVPPAARHRLREAASFVREHWRTWRRRPDREKLQELVPPPELEPLPDELLPELAVPGYELPEGRRGFPMPVATALMFETDQQHDEGGSNG